MSQGAETLSDIYNLVVRLDERQALMSITVDRIEKAVYGNGTPGIKSRVEGIERVQASGCPAVSAVSNALDRVEERHQHEDEEAAASNEAKKDGKRELRKFYLSLTAGVIMLAVDILVRLSGLI